jgi:hypothetical protein
MVGETMRLCFAGVLHGCIYVCYLVTVVNFFMLLLICLTCYNWMIYCYINLTAPPHQSKNRGSTAPNCDSDPIGEAGPLYFHLVQYPEQRSVTRRFSGYLRPSGLNITGI